MRGGAPGVGFAADDPASARRALAVVRSKSSGCVNAADRLGTASLSRAAPDDALFNAMTDQPAATASSNANTTGNQLWSSLVPAGGAEGRGSESMGIPGPSTVRPGAASP